MYANYSQTQQYAPPPRHYSQSQSHGYSHSSGYQHQQGPPPGSDPQLWQYFSAVDTDRSGAISVTELQTALVNGMRNLRVFLLWKG